MLDKVRKMLAERPMPHGLRYLGVPIEEFTKDELCKIIADALPGEPYESVLSEMVWIDLLLGKEE